MRILVTGCSGRVGAAVCADLISNGIDVVGIDLTPPGDDAVVYHRLDLNDGDTTTAALLPILADVDTVVHLAAIPVPRAGTPPAIFDLNCAATFRLYDACATAGIGHVTVASSINALGYYFGCLPFELAYLPVDEDHPKTTSDPYSFSKQITEEIAAYFHRTAGIGSWCLRFGAGLQPLDEMRAGLGLRLAKARASVEALLRLDTDERASRVRRLRDAYDAHRAQGEPPGDTTLTREERSLMGLRHNLFSFVELGEACRGIRLAATTPAKESHPLFVVDAHNALDFPADDLAGALFPDVPCREPLTGTQSLVSWQGAAERIRFESSIPATAIFPAD